MFRRERVFAHDQHAPVRGGLVLVTLLLALSAFIFIAACSFSQVTDEPHALRVLRSSIAATTEIDLLIAVGTEDVRAAAGSTDGAAVHLGGFPFDVSLTAEEARVLTPDEVRARLLDRAAAAVYSSGMGAFDRTGSQDLDSLTSQGMLNRALGTLTETNHDRATALALVSLGASVVLGALTLAFREGPGRFTLLGGSLALAGALGLVISGLLYLVVRVLAGGSDPLVGELQDLVERLVEAPLRNFAVLAVLGGAVWSMVAVLRAIDRTPPPEDEWDDDYSYDWYDEDEPPTAGLGRGQA